MPLFLLDIPAAIGNFFDSGGPVLYFIAGLMFIMWVLLIERAWYLAKQCPRDAGQIQTAWQARSDRSSWFAHAVRDRFISEMHLKIEKNLALIKTLIAICPLFGLLGTVTGMIDVFTVLSITGGGDARSMAAGVSRATIPTMAGMVAALSGVFASVYINQKATTEKELIEERLTTD